jgi:hypothetical protein
MELKTNQVKGNIRIEIYADLDGWDSTETSIKNEILNTPFEYWELDNFNLLDVGNNEVLDIFVFETSNEIIFNVNDIL